MHINLNKAFLYNSAVVGILILLAVYGQAMPSNAVLLLLFLIGLFRFWAMEDKRGRKDIEELLKNESGQLTVSWIIIIVVLLIVIGSFMPIITDALSTVSTGSPQADILFNQIPMFIVVIFLVSIALIAKSD